MQKYSTNCRHSLKRSDRLEASKWGCSQMVMFSSISKFIFPSCRNEHKNAKLDNTALYKSPNQRLSFKVWAIWFQVYFSNIWISNKKLTAIVSMEDDLMRAGHISLSSPSSWCSKLLWPFVKPFFKLFLPAAFIVAHLPFGVPVRLLEPSLCELDFRWSFGTPE